MSESTSAPSTPASSPAPASTPAPAAPAPDSGVSPPANDRPPISVSEAARLLSRQRRETSPSPPPATTPERRPPAAELAKATATPPPAPTPAPSPLSAMEKALGVPPTAPPSQESTLSAPETSQNTLEALEIEGRRYTSAELREAVLKSTDYTKKTQDLATERQSLAAERQQLQAQQRALAEVLPYLQPELTRLEERVQNPPQPPDPALIETNQQQYLRDRAIYEHALAEQQRLFSLNNLQGQAQQRALEQQVAVANEQLAKELPFWADPQQRLEAQQQIVEWATSKGGFSRDELRGLSSPHHLKTMMKAAMFDRWVEGAKTSAPPSSSVPARGVAPPPAPSERIAAATEAFQARPDARSGAALIAARRAAMNGNAR